MRLCSIGLRVASAQGLGFWVYNIYICSHDKMMVKWGETCVQHLVNLNMLLLQSGMLSLAYTLRTWSDPGLLQDESCLDVHWRLPRAGDFLRAPWARRLLSDASDFKEEDIYPVSAQIFDSLYTRIPDPFAEGRLNCDVPC